MKQNKLVKIAIDILIHGESNIYNWVKELDNKRLCIGPKLHCYNCKSSKDYNIYFDKTIKNMALLCVLFRDWCNKNDNKHLYKGWIKEGTKFKKGSE